MLLLHISRAVIYKHYLIAEKTKVKKFVEVGQLRDKSVKKRRRTEDGGKSLMKLFRF